jgi:hypothetical protein
VIHIGPTTNVNAHIIPQPHSPEKVSANGKTNRETEHVPFRMIRLEAIRPHWLNDQIYGPVNPDDPDVKALARSIKDNRFLPTETAPKKKGGK